MADTSTPTLDLFEDPDHAASYANGPARFVPGFAGLHKMAGVLIRETAPPDAKVLVHGAGGGLELQAFADQNPNWRLVGVDPARPMLEAARSRLGPLNKRVTLIHGFAEDAPGGPFDAATSFLTLHFLDAEARRKAVRQLVRRLKPGAPFITVHCSFPQSPAKRASWLTRHRDYVVASGVAPAEAEAARQSISDDLELFDPELDEDILRQAGLQDVTMFYSAFTWRGWVGRAA
ncbi:MAG: methyltransferase domain-containing protein [Pseudomonadota bacterium]